MGHLRQAAWTSPSRHRLRGDPVADGGNALGHPVGNRLHPVLSLRLSRARSLVEIPIEAAPRARGCSDGGAHPVAGSLRNDRSDSEQLPQHHSARSSPGHRPLPDLGTPAPSLRPRCAAWRAIDIHRLRDGDRRCLLASSLDRGVAGSSSGLARRARTPRSPARDGVRLARVLRRIPSGLRGGAGALSAPDPPFPLRQPNVRGRVSTDGSGFCLARRGPGPRHRRARRLERTADGIIIRSPPRSGPARRHIARLRASDSPWARASGR